MPARQPLESSAVPTGPTPPTRRRGRPPTITRARIAAAGADLPLPAITFTDIAERLGVTQVALYKHVSGVDEVRRIVAEAIFTGWELPDPTRDIYPGLPQYLTAFSDSLRRLVHQHPGIVGFLARRGAATPAMGATIVDHHQQVAAAYGLDAATARWLLSTMAFHCVALADTVYTSYLPNIPHSGDTVGTDSDVSAQAAVEDEFDWSMRALIIGMLSVAGLPLEPDPGWALDTAG